MRWPASARACRTTTRRAPSRASRTSRRSTSGCAASTSRVEALKWGVTRRGILALSPTLVYCFWHSGETAESSDLQLTFTPASYKEGEQGQLEDEPGMTCRLLAAAPGEPRLRPLPLGRSVRGADHPDQLSGRGDRPPRVHRRHEAGAAAARVLAAGALLRPRGLGPGPACRPTTSSWPPRPSAARRPSIPAAPAAWGRPAIR